MLGIKAGEYSTRYLKPFCVQVREAALLVADSMPQKAICTGKCAHVSKVGKRRAALSCALRNRRTGSDSARGSASLRMDALHAEIKDQKLSELKAAARAETVGLG